MAGAQKGARDRCRLGLGGWLLEHLTRSERDRMSDLKLGWLDFDRERIDENVA